MACSSHSNEYILLMFVFFIIAMLGAVILETTLSEKDKHKDNNINIILGLDIAVLAFAFITFFYMFSRTLYT